MLFGVRTEIIVIGTVVLVIVIMLLLALYGYYTGAWDRPE